MTKVRYPYGDGFYEVEAEKVRHLSFAFTREELKYSKLSLWEMIQIRMERYHESIKETGENYEMVYDEREVKDGVTYIRRGFANRRDVKYFPSPKNIDRSSAHDPR